MESFEVIQGGRLPIKAWTRGVPVEDVAREQLLNLANMPFIHKHIAVMPDVHWGMGATVGSVIATKGAVIPAAVGVDIGCGMNAVRLSIKTSDLPDSLKDIRSQIERDVPVGFGIHQKAAIIDAHAARISKPPASVLAADDRGIEKAAPQVGTLGGGNHFIELCVDESQDVWIMLHSGSRGIGNRIGVFYIEKARRAMEQYFISLPDRDLAYIPDNTPLFADYIEAVEWAQKYAMLNRMVMMEAVIAAVRRHIPKPFEVTQEAINCHHNYVSRENHFGENVIVTRKGAVSARAGQLGIIPGSMGAKSFIVCGKGHLESFCSCSHGAGRAMSRNEAKKRFSLQDHIAATEGVECRKDGEVIDETPAAYKSIDAVMGAQADLVDIVHTLKQVVCVKG